MGAITDLRTNPLLKALHEEMRVVITQDGKEVGTKIVNFYDLLLDGSGWNDFPGVHISVSEDETLYEQLIDLHDCRIHDDFEVWSKQQDQAKIALLALGVYAPHGAICHKDNRWLVNYNSAMPRAIFAPGSDEYFTLVQHMMFLKPHYHVFMELIEK